MGRKGILVRLYWIHCLLKSTGKYDDDGEVDNCDDYDDDDNYSGDNDDNDDYDVDKDNSPSLFDSLPSKEYRYWIKWWWWYDNYGGDNDDDDYDVDKDTSPSLFDSLPSKEYRYWIKWWWWYDDNDDYDADKILVRVYSIYCLLKSTGAEYDDDYDGDDYDDNDDYDADNDASLSLFDSSSSKEYWY
jgi:hypothetical protein